MKCTSLAVLALFASPAGSLRVATSAAPSLGRRDALRLGVSAALFAPCAAIAAEPEPLDCGKECFRECNNVAPGNEAYCRGQCDDYCAADGPVGKADVLRTDVTEAAGGKDCGSYKTDAARQYCEKSNKQAAAKQAAAIRNPSGALNNGIFGDSGVSYSSGVEDLLATAFGATRQQKNVNEANVDEFAGDILKAAGSVISGGK